MKTMKLLSAGILVALCVIASGAKDFDAQFLGGKTLFLSDGDFSGTNCSIATDGTDSPTCGTSSAVACKTLSQCLQNTKGADGMCNVTALLSAGEYNGDGFCGLTLNGTVGLMGLSNGAIIDCKGESQNFVYHQEGNATGLYTVAFQSIHFRNGKSMGNGGCLAITGVSKYVALSISNSSFEGCQAAGNGGAIYIGAPLLGGSITAIFTNNSATNGGALCTEGLSQFLDIDSSQFLHNVASHDGGAIYVKAGLHGLVNSHLAGNTAQRAGGAVHMVDRIVFFENITVEENIAMIGGGFSFDASGTMDSILINNINFTANEATHQGAAVFVGSLGDSNTTTQLSFTIRGFLVGNVGNGVVYLEVKAISSSFGAATAGYISNSVGSGLVLNVSDSGPYDRFNYWYVMTESGNNSGENIQCLGAESTQVPFCVSACPIVNSTCENCPGGCSFNANNTECFYFETVDCQHGHCLFDEGPFCECSEGYSGETCEQEDHKKKPESEWYIKYMWALVAGGGVVLFAVIIVAILVARKYSKKSNYERIQ